MTRVFWPGHTPPGCPCGGDSNTIHIHSVAGLTGDRTALVTARPCRVPHYTILEAGLIGGGHVPMPGDVSLAHHGVLLLDEVPEFRHHVLEVLWQPREEGGTAELPRSCLIAE
jgi:predicted ATPase with chaperone activity